MEPRHRITLTLFSDPMMGLAYECEPTLDRLAATYGDSLELVHAMVVLVRDVADFMTGEERALPPALGLARYNARLAQIYLDEETIGGLPMNMDDFRLFDTGHRSSEPLCLAFEAARIASPERAEAYLRALQRATIVDRRQTTRDEVLREVALETGVDPEAFDQALVFGSAAAALRSDRGLATRVGVSGLPALLINVGDAAVLTSPLAGYDRLRRTIDGMLGHSSRE